MQAHATAHTQHGSLNEAERESEMNQVKTNQTETNLVRVRFFAAAADAAGSEELELPIEHESQQLEAFVAELPDLVTAQPQTSDAPGATSSPSLSAVCARSSFLLNGRRVSPTSVTLKPGDELDILPPFAGG